MDRYDKHCRKIHAEAGKPFAVELESVPTAGYQWSAKLENDLLNEVSHDTHVGGNIGGSTREVFVFKPRASGRSKLLLEYRRPWETGNAEQVEIEITIGKGRPGR